MNLPPPEAVELVLRMAREAAQKEEVPVASAIFRIESESDRTNGDLAFQESPDAPVWRLIAADHNRIVEKHDPTAHAEMLSLKKTAAILDNERLNGLTMITLLEPCVMCGGALILARLDTVYYLAREMKAPAMEQLLALSNHGRRFNHHPELIHLDQYQEEASALLRQFFRKKRE